MRDKNSFILAMVAVVAIAGIVMMINDVGTRSGDMAGQAALPRLIDTTACIDTDGGQNFYVKGSTYNTYDTRDDNCNDGDSAVLTEHYCRENKVLWIEQECKYGCLDGACNKESPEG